MTSSAFFKCLEDSNITNLWSVILWRNYFKSPFHKVWSIIFCIIRMVARINSSSFQCQSYCSGAISAFVFAVIRISVALDVCNSIFNCVLVVTRCYSRM